VPEIKALRWVQEYRPGLFKIVVCRPEDYAAWMRGIPDGVMLIARYYGAGDVDYWEWTEANANTLADLMERAHEVLRGRVDAWECVNEPVVNSVPSMKRLAAFERAWAERMRARGLKTIVGNFAVGNPEPELMPYFRPALEAADYFGYHGYGAPRILSGAEWYALRYRRLLEAAGLEKPVILTEAGVDGGVLGGRLRGWRTFCTDDEYVAQLKEFDRVLQEDERVVGATIFCYGNWDSRWQTFDLTSRAALLLGEYVASSSWDEAACGEWLRNLLWNELGVPYNPDAAFPRVAREHGLGRPVTPEGRAAWRGVRVAFQGFANGFVFCREGDWGNVRVWKW